MKSIGKFSLAVTACLLASVLLVKAEEIPPAAPMPRIEFSLPAEARVGEIVLLHAGFAPAAEPAGARRSVRANVLSAPEGGKLDILPGVPDSDLRFSAPGTYELQAEAGLLSKGSCGAVEYVKLGEQRLSIRVK